MTEIEIWKPIPNYESIYEVSNLGRIKSLERTVQLNSRNTTRKLKEKILSLNPYSDSYPIVSLHKNKITEIRQVHKIVALVFNPNPENLPFINHLNGNKKDCRAINLEWCTHLQNMHHAFSTGLIPSGEKSHKAKLSNENVLVIKRLLKINPNTNQSAIARKFNVGRSTINAISKKKKWKYINNKEVK